MNACNHQHNTETDIEIDTALGRSMAQLPEDMQ